MDIQKPLRELHPEHDHFIGIDSDGCVFDTMEIKQKKFFIPNALRIFDLYQVSDKLRSTWEFVNLYSVYRGGNRFISLIKVFELLSNDHDVRKSGVQLPDIKALKLWATRENKLGNDNLRKFVETNHDAGLVKILLWSETVNKDIEENMGNVPPFPAAQEAFGLIYGKADIVIVSQTPLEAIEREWDENNLRKYVRLIAAQEHGTKTEHLSLAAKGKYDNDKILMIGDAKGDLDAARNNNILFYPIMPGYEDASWKRFISEGFSKFLNGYFKGDYENDLLREFMNLLPERPAR